MIVEQGFRVKPEESARKDSASRRAGEQALFVPNPKLKLKDQVHEVMRFFHYSPRTEETYWHWIERFVRFCRKVPHSASSSSTSSKTASGGGADAVDSSLAGGWRHPRELGAAEVAAFLSHLATAGQVAAATQNQSKT